MLGGYENIVALPTMGVFDTSMMQADIAAAREMYNLARDDYKDFLKTYGDFFSISDVDNANYYKMTLGAANDLIQKYGPSLTRSAEGRAAIWNMINGIDKKAIANMRASAETMQQFIKARDALAAQGRYDERWDKYYSNMVDPTSWDSTKGVWTRTAPSAVQTLHDLTREEFEKLEPSENIGTFKGDDGVTYSVMGVSDATKAQSFEAAKRRVEATPGAQMYKDNIRASLMNDPSFKNKSDVEITAEVNKRFDDLILQEQSMYTQPRHVVNPKWNMDYSAALSRRYGGGGGSRYSYEDDGYLTVENQGLNSLRGIERQFNLSYDTVWDTAVEYGSSNGWTAQLMLDNLETNFNSSLLSDWMVRDPVQGDHNRVYLQNSDIDKLKTAEELINKKQDNAGNKSREMLKKVMDSSVLGGDMVLVGVGGQVQVPDGRGGYDQMQRVKISTPSGKGETRSGVVTKMVKQLYTTKDFYLPTGYKFVRNADGTYSTSKLSAGAQSRDLRTTVNNKAKQGTTSAKLNNK